MRKHPELGARILAGADLPDLAEWVFAHHERMDGSGYPLGLAARFPLEARILAVADAYEAMTSARPYSPRHGPRGRGRGAAPLRGTQFDAAWSRRFSGLWQDRRALRFLGPAR